MHTYLVCALLLGITASTAGAFEVVLTPQEPQPGEVLRIEVLGIDNPARAACAFRGKPCTLYPIAPGRMRALVGLTARTKAGWYPLKVTRARFLLPDETRDFGIKVHEKRFTHQQITMPVGKTRLATQAGAREGTLLIRNALGTGTPHQRWSGPFKLPSEGRRSSQYGHTRTINKKMSWDWHKGIDIAAQAGAEVLAPNGGRVVLTGRFPIQGGTLILDHGQGVMSAFLHLESFGVEQGDLVRQGAHIANVGGGGFSTGSHLHWGVYIHGEAVDPAALLLRRL